MKFLTPCLFVLLSVSASFAQETPTPTPTVTPTVTPTATPTLSACAAVQSCVDTAVAAVIDQCLAANPACSKSGKDKYAVSAGELVRRVVDSRKCTQKKTRFACTRCYQNAKVPLKLRFKGDIFHGALGQAVKLLEAERRIVCNALKRK